MEKKESKGERNGHTNRILLNTEVLSKIDNWRAEVQKAFKGMKVTRADIANHLLGSRAKSLSPEEVHQIGNMHFDDVRFTAWALLALKEAKARGESTTLRALIDAFGIERLPSEQKN